MEVLTSKTQKVTPEWLEFSTTAKAKGKIQAVLRRENREMQKKGEEILTDFLTGLEKEINSTNIEKLCMLHNVTTREALLAGIGDGRFVLGNNDKEILQNKDGDKNNWSKYLKFFRRKAKEESDADEPIPSTHENIDRKKPLILNEETITHYIICDSCHPIPGDDVLGYLDDKNRITIHKRQCPIAARLKSNDGNQILAANWDTHKLMSFLANIRLDGIDHLGVLHQITDVLSKQMNVNIRKLNIKGEIQLEVHDVADVQNICRDLKKIDEIEEVTRF